MTSAESSDKPAETPFRILLVDDNRDFVEFVSVLLSHHGFAVCRAYNGSDCLKIVRKQNADLAVLDVMMPTMDGLTVCRELKQLCPSLPVILLTAKDDLATRAAAMALGVSEFLTKPLNTEDFLMRVRTQCRAAQWGKTLGATVGTVDEHTDWVKPA